MENKNKNNLLVVLLVVFIITTLALSGFVVYDKFISEDAPVVNNGDGNIPNDNINDEKNPINNENANVNNNNNNSNNNNNNVDNNDNSVIEKGEIITELELISDEDENTRRVYLNEGNVVCSDCNKLSIGNSKVISLNYAYSCAGNYNIYYLLDNGQVYVNDENVQRFFKLGAVEVKTSEKIVGMQSYASGSNSCGARDVYFIGESGNKYKASLSCNNSASHVVKAELISYTSQVDGSCKNVK